MALEFFNSPTYFFLLGQRKLYFQKLAHDLVWYMRITYCSPIYLWGTHSKTLSGCLKPWMVPNANQLLQLCWKYGSSFFISRHNLSSNFFFLFFFFLKDFIYLFLDRGEGRETERERNINVWLPLMCSALGTTGDLARNPGMCPNWELNQQPSDSQAGTQSTEPHQPRLLLDIFFYLFIYLFIF